MYSTKRKTGKLINQWILSWVVIGVGVIRLIVKLVQGIQNFQNLGDMLSIALLLGVGIVVMINSNKSIRKIKGHEFDLSGRHLVYKINDDEEVFNAEHPAKSIEKSLTQIKIVTLENREININLDDYLLDFNQLKTIETAVNELNSIFKQGNT